jgi:signal transduction histidine kinase
MSHELRTPLNAIMGVTEILQEDARELNRGDQIEPLDRIQRAARHLLALINDILDLSKIEAGKMELVLESFLITAMIEDVIRTVEPIASRTGTGSWRTARPGPALYADQMCVRQALLNRVSNASKFTSNGTVTVSASRQTGEGERIGSWCGPGIVRREAGRQAVQEFSQATRRPRGSMAEPGSDSRSAGASAR